MKRVGVLIAAPVAALVLAGPAHAADPSGTMTYDEWSAQVVNHLSITKVEAACTCSGSLYGGPWVGKDGARRKMVTYGPTPPSGTASYPTGDGGIVQFRRWPNGSWHVNHTKWWLGAPTGFETVVFAKPVS